MIEYVRVERAPDTTFKTCGFRGCTSFASHVLRAGDAALCFCCAQCAAVGVKAHRPRTFVVKTGGYHVVGVAIGDQQPLVIRFDEALALKNKDAITFTVQFKRRLR